MYIHKSTAFQIGMVEESALRVVSPYFQQNIIVVYC